MTNKRIQRGKKCEKMVTIKNPHKHFHKNNARRPVKKITRLKSCRELTGPIYGLPSWCRCPNWRSYYEICLTLFWPMFYFITTENTKKQRFSSVFRGYNMGTLARNGLKWVKAMFLLFQYFPLFCGKVSIIQKPVDWLTKQINQLLSKWWELAAENQKELKWRVIRAWNEFRISWQ